MKRCCSIREKGVPCIISFSDNSLSLFIYRKPGLFRRYHRRSEWPQCRVAGDDFYRKDRTSADSRDTEGKALCDKPLENFINRLSPASKSLLSR
jgi:hypothetical protein